MIREANRLRWVWCVLGVALAAVALSGGSAAAAESESPSCPSKAGPGFLKPLASFPRVVRVPKSGAVGFGPRGIRLEPLATLRVGKGKIGYRLRLTPSVRMNPPDWKITARLLRVNGQGLVTSVLETRTLSVLSATGKGLAFQVRGFRGYYRVDVRIIGRNGLITYGAYFRVVEPTMDPLFRFRSRSVKAGESLFFRVVNFGTETFAEDSGYEVERLDGADWVLYLQEPANPGPKVRLGLRDGAAGRCFEIPIPAGAVPGKYRLSKEIFWPLPPETPGSGGYLEEFSVVP